jgi:demethylmenaquinone methyltransferase/2-methoxy-6-polyprenyl-1,4-benzoquinol methylase
VADAPQARLARALFDPIAVTYDRYARLLSLGQDPRWRRFLVSRLDVGPQDTVLDVATGTAAVAIELARSTGCTVIGVDQSAEMLAVGRRRIARAGFADRIHLVEGRAERLEFADARFDAVTFTYLLRYVGDPAATLRELARVTRPGGTIASLEFAVPRAPIWRALWELYVRLALPLAGRAISPGWRRVGRALGPTIRGLPSPEQLAESWTAAGIGDVHVRRLSFGGGVVTWGIKR